MVSRRSIWRKRRSADPEYRKKERERRRAYRAAHKDTINARRRAKYRAAPGHHIERLYGISPSEYRALFESQGGVCSICGQMCRRRLAVDHCHASGKVRGLLCSKCNAGLGMYGDDTDRMRAAIAYLERSRRAPTSETEVGGGPHAAGGLVGRDDEAVWTVNEIEDAENAWVDARAADRMSIHDVAEETGIPRSTVHRLNQELEWDTRIDSAGTAGRAGAKT